MSIKPPRSEGDPELAEALSKLSEGLKEGEDPFFYDWRAKPKPSAISSGGVDEARAYVPPTTVPPTTAHKTFEMQRVKIAPQVDPRRQPTQPRMRMDLSAADELAALHATADAPPRPKEPFLPAVSPPPGPVATKPARSAEIADEATPPTVRETSPPNTPAPKDDAGPPARSSNGSESSKRSGASANATAAADERSSDAVATPAPARSNAVSADPLHAISPVPRSVAPVTREPADASEANADAERVHIAPLFPDASDASGAHHSRLPVAIFAIATAIGCIAAVVLVVRQGSKAPVNGDAAAIATAVNATSSAPMTAQPAPTTELPASAAIPAAPIPSAPEIPTPAVSQRPPRATEAVGAAKRSAKPVRGAATPAPAPPTATATDPPKPPPGSVRVF